MMENNHSLEVAMLAHARKKEREYWLNQLSGQLSKTSLPHTLKKIDISNSMEMETFKISDSLFERLMTLSKGNDKSLFIILMTNVIALLKRYTGNNDILIGVPIYRQIEKNLINKVLVLRNNVQDDMSFKEMLIHGRKVFLEAVENQNYPIEALFEEIDMVGIEEGSHLFDIAVLLENLHDQEYITPAKPSVIIAFNRTDSMLEGRIEYNSALFKKTMMKRFSEHLQNCLQQVVITPEVQLKDINFLGEEERQKVLVDFNATAFDTPTHKTIHQIFEEEAELHPDKIAVEINEETITFRELDARANQLANYLIQAKGLPYEARVGVLLDKSIEFIIAFFGILKAGCTYVPMHNSFPEKKIKDMIEDAEIGVMISFAHYHEMLSKLQEEVAGFNSILYLDNLKTSSAVEKREAYQDVDDLSHFTTEKPNREVKPTNMAYVIYTSGTTGKPKGVMLEHKGICNVHICYRKIMGIYPEDRVGQFMRCTFDASVGEIVRSLLLGATLVLIPEEIIQNYREFEKYMNNHRISVVTLPPNYLTYLNPDNIHTLRLLITGGSETNFELVNKWRNKVDYANGYGPTEYSIATSIWKVPEGEIIYDSVPIGKPNFNTHVYIVDGYNNLQPIGVPGELCVSGVGIARGYLKRPELTAEKFVDNPFSPGTKMYRTGDLVSWFEDGNIKYYGRNDDQVKIRGFRIELGEIKSRLLVYPGIQDVAVIARKDEDGEKYICAYYVAPEVISEADFHNYLRKELPDYMIPGYFIRLEHMPLTLHGKLDTRALPAPQLRVSSAEIIPPLNELQINLAKIWSEILNMDEAKIGITNDFFELGGHSLKATQMVVKLEQEFGVKIPLRDLFKYGTIQHLAERINQAKQERYASIAVVDTKEYYPLSASQSRFYRIHEDFTGSTGTILNKWEARFIEGKLDFERLERSFHTLIQRHESLRTSFTRQNGKPVQRIHESVDFHIERYSADKAEVQTIVEQFIRPFDLGKAPLLRAGLIELSEEQSVIIFDRHLIIADGVSMGNIVRDLMTLYQGTTLPDLRIQYKDYAVWQQEFLKTDELRKQEQYWQNQLKDIESYRLPLDYPEPENPTFVADHVHMLIPSNLTTGIHQLANRERVTEYMILLAIYSIVLSQHFGQKEIVVGTPIAGRHHPNLEPIIGMFINTLVMYNRVDALKTFAEFLTEVKQTALKAYENQDYQFGMLDGCSEFVSLPIGFAMHNMEQVTTNLLGVHFSPYRLDKKNTLSHLHLTAVEGNEGIQLNFEYRPELYKRTTIEAIGKMFLRAVQNIVNDSKVEIAKIK